MGTFHSKHSLPKKIVDKKLTYSEETIIVKQKNKKEMLLVPFEKKINKFENYDFVLKINPSVSFVIYDFIYREAIDTSRSDVYIKLLTKLDNSNTKILYLSDNFNFDMDKINDTINKNLLASSRLIYNEIDNDTIVELLGERDNLEYKYYNYSWRRSDEENKFNKYLITSNESVYFEIRKDNNCIKTLEYYLFFILVIIIICFCYWTINKST